MRLINNQRFTELQRNPQNIRNLCILAHVDHGKTTLADSLVASNGIISHRLVGKLRYMDSRKDEQERGITMKSSSISLHHKVNNEEYLINLIDSPGHVDFSSEVSTGVRLCDGAIIVVDVVEGVCAQTKVVLRQAWLEHIKPVLVLNKIDRLITELKFQPLDAYIRMAQVLEQVNAQVGELFAMDVMSKAEGNSDWSSGLEEADDSNIYFAPEQGNVVFASAADGWGFSVQDFVSLFASKLGVEENALRQSLWGDYFYNAKTKSILSGAQAKAKKPLFVQIVLEHLWAVYDAIIVRKDKVMLEKIVEKLNLKVSPRDMKHSDPKVQVQAVLCQWLPLSEAVLRMVCENLPSPLTMSEARAEKLMCSQSKTFDSLPEDSQELKKYFVSCSSETDAPVIVFVSKMVLVERQSLPQFKPRPLTSEDIAQRREQVRKRHAELQEQQAKQSGLQQEPVKTIADDDNKSVSSNEISHEPEHVFIAFARVFSGTLRKGQELYVLGPKYDPSVPLDANLDLSLTLKDLKNGQYVTRCQVGNLYLLMGRELEELESAPAGNVVGIGGLEDHVLKSATLSSTLRCPAFTELTQMAVPIVRVAVEPSRPIEMQALIRGLKLLNQADPCVQVLLQETGEHVLVTAGEVHLQRCLQDLKERYAHVEVNASPPIVPFRETIVASSEGTESNDGLVEIQTPNKRCTLKIRAVPLPSEVTALLEKNGDILKRAVKTSNKNLEVSLDGLTLNESAPAIKTSGYVGQFKEELEKVFNSSGTQWKDAVDSIISFGPRRCGPNVLINKSPMTLPNFWAISNIADASMPEFMSSFINGFQLATLAGPICEEPLMGVAFIVEECSVLPAETEVANQPYGPFSGQIISSVKEGCRRAFQNQQQRLMAAMYSCSIQVSGEVVGKMYGVISKRHGRIVEGDLTEGSASFSVTAYLPVIESFDLASEIRKQTSGQASHQLVFSHWEVIDTDPFWVPTTEEELELYGDKGDSVNRAQVYMNAVRKRKGLPVLEKVVEFAEKQRTLSRKV